MRIRHSIIWLCTSGVLFLSACGGVTVKDKIVWSYIGAGADPSRPTVAALGSHTNYVKHEYMTIDQWVDFLSATPDHGPALCNSSGDYTEGKTELEQACAKAGCTYEEKKVLSDVSARIDRHIYIVKTIKRRQLEWEQ